MMLPNYRVGDCRSAQSLASVKLRYTRYGRVYTGYKEVLVGTCTFGTLRDRKIREGPIIIVMGGQGKFTTPSAAR